MKYKIIAPIALCVAILAIFVRFTVAEPHRLSGDCMEPTFRDGKQYFLNRLSFYLRKPQINEVVLFSHENKVMISRIVALEKNEVLIKEGSVLVDGLTLEEKVTRNWSNWDYGKHAINESLKVPKDHVFVLSDNLDCKHDDSRVFGPISYSSILGLLW